MSEMSENTVTYLAETGDRILLADGRVATVTRCNPYFNPKTQVGGTYYDVLLRGGDEIVVYHSGGDTVEVFRGYPLNGETQPLFTVVPDPAPVVDLDREVTQDEVKALIAIEVAERLAVKAHHAIRDGYYSVAQDILEDLVGVTTTRTTTAVKDQALSDHISQQAAAVVRKVMSE